LKPESMFVGMPYFWCYGSTFFVVFFYWAEKHLFYNYFKNQLVLREKTRNG